MSPIHSLDLTPLRHRFISGCTESNTRTLPAMIEQSIYIPTLTRMLINLLLTHYQSPPRLPRFPYDTFLPFTHPVSLHQTHIGLPPLPLGCHMPVLAYLDVLPVGPFPASPPPPGVCHGFPPGQWPVWVRTGPIQLAFPQASGPFGLSPASSYGHSPRPVARLGLHHRPFWAPSRPFARFGCT